MSECNEKHPPYSLKSCPIKSVVCHENRPILSADIIGRFYRPIKSAVCHRLKTVITRAALPPHSLPLQMVRCLLRAQPVSVANHNHYTIRLIMWPSDCKSNTVTITPSDDTITELVFQLLHSVHPPGPTIRQDS